MCPCRIQLLTPGGGGFGDPERGGDAGAEQRHATDEGAPVLRTGSVAAWNAQAEAA